MVSNCILQVYIFLDSGNHIDVCAVDVNREDVCDMVLTDEQSKEFSAAVEQQVMHISARLW